jgi:hypothetical protein
MQVGISSGPIGETVITWFRQPLYSAEGSGAVSWL